MRVEAGLVLTALLLSSGCGPRRVGEKNWALAWSDEFNGPAGSLPDSARWTSDTGAGGYGNNELETYCAPGSAAAPCDPAAPNAVDDGLGHLIIAAVRTPSGAWTSARLKTLGLAQFEYGRIEARIRLPTGPGLWPAFWGLGVDISTAGWPNCGEIDVMENVPAEVPRGLGPDKIKSTVHGPGYFGDNGLGEVFKFPSGGRVDDGFHVYGTIWSPGKVQFYVDDWTKPFLSLTPADVPPGTKWVFDKPFFIIMNLAVGGSWPKDPGPQTPSPARMLVDYVRVYTPAVEPDAVSRAQADTGSGLTRDDRKFLDDLVRRNFRYFKEQADPVTGQVLDRAAFNGGASHNKDAKEVSSVAATGFGLSGLCVSLAHGDIKKEQAVSRAKATLAFLKDKAPQEHGFFYHFIDARTGARQWNSEASSIDTALLLAGALTAKQCLGDPEVATLADEIYARVDFPWMLNGSPDLLSMGWTPEHGFIEARWDTYSEHMILDLLAIGSPTHPIPPAEWDAWKRPTVDAGGQSFIAGTSPLFIHQYAQAYIDFRGTCDRHSLNYFDNSVKATLAQRKFMSDLGKDPSGKYAGWSDDIWGLTASDTCSGGYAAWGAPPLEGPADGTVVPSAPGGSLMFTPKESLFALRAMKGRYPKTYGRYGFADSFHPRTGCVNKDVLGIDQGITLLSAANLESGAVWNAFMKNPEITRAMGAVGFGACPAH
jgi:hypothetical protein